MGFHQVKATIFGSLPQCTRKNYIDGLAQLKCSVDPSNSGQNQAAIQLIGRGEWICFPRFIHDAATFSEFL